MENNYKFPHNSTSQPPPTREGQYYTHPGPGKLYKSVRDGDKMVWKECGTEGDKMSKGLCIECEHHEIKAIKIGIYGNFSIIEEDCCMKYFNPVDGTPRMCQSIRTGGVECPGFKKECKCKKSL
jgi:hypothetical protein